jgi:DNA-binding transcriptional LysR family regulator
MELRHLRYFVAVAEALNFTKASARLRVAQPALSRQVQDLEDEIGVDLLKRSPRGVTLTGEGKLFVEEARDLLRRADEAVKKVRALTRGEYGELHIGYSPTPTIEILPPALAAFQKEVPGVQMLLHDMSSDEIVDGLRRGSIELAVTPLTTNEQVPDLDFEEIKSYPFCVALPPGHPLTRMKSIPLEKVATEPLVTLDQKHYPGARSLLEHLFAPLGMKPRIAVECDSGSSVVAAIEAGRGIAITFPVLKLVTGKRLAYRPVTGVTEKIPVGVVWGKTGDLTPAGERFCEILRRLSKERPTSGKRSR